MDDLKRNANTAITFAMSLSKLAGIVYTARPDIPANKYFRVTLLNREMVYRLGRAIGHYN